MEPHEILSFAIDRSSAVNTYWTIFISVSTAVVGIMASRKMFSVNKALKIFLTIAFIAFAYSNLDAIIRLGNLRQALVNMLPKDLQNYEQVVESLSPPENWLYIAFHMILDSVVIALIWFVPWISSTEYSEEFIKES